MSAIYEDEFVQLFAGDYRDHLPMLQGLSVDAVITDPPYGETSLAWDRWVTGWVDDAASIADVLWSFGSFRMFFEHAAEFGQWKLAQDIVWEKHNGSSLAADRFRRVHELGVMFYRGEWSAIRHMVPTTADATARTVRRKAVPAQHLGSRGESHFTSEDGGPRMMRSVMAVRSEHGRAIHPTQKPLGIVMPLIEYSVPVGGAGGRPVRWIRHDGSRCANGRPSVHRVRGGRRHG